MPQVHSSETQLIDYCGCREEPAGLRKSAGFDSRGSDPKFSTLNKWRRALELGDVVFIDAAIGEEHGPACGAGDAEGEALVCRGARPRQSTRASRPPTI